MMFSASIAFHRRRTPFADTVSACVLIQNYIFVSILARGTLTIIIPSDIRKSVATGSHYVDLSYCPVVATLSTSTVAHIPSSTIERA